MKRFDFPALSFESIQFSSESQLSRAEIFRVPADAVFDVLSRKTKYSARCLAAQGDVDVRVIGVEVRNGHPFQWRTEVMLHTGQELARVAAKIEPLAKLRRDDQLEQTLVTGALPDVQPLRDVDPLLVRREARPLVCGDLIPA